ncbi:DUF937 domain-containing protein [Pricia sp. S334]|uniref:DUF937 domain-containing protein n=1 Tax=Pricia mediterranea TaxID=3076079 RepID=A0ABU3LBD7_9FLAO|nr:DUF937 domain-containing protein [Pricia sp. S334]MDT7830382.1 DUF937 domain-containing protein [Pricia sp. S334]
MSGLLDLLNSPTGKQMISGVADQTGNSIDQTGSVLTMALPLLMGAMKKNAATPEGAQGLMSALSNNHDGSILNNLSGLFGGGVDESVKKDGAGILGHVLGNKQSKVESAISQKSGVDTSSVASILKIAAPILLGLIGQKKQQENINEPSGIQDLLGSMMGGGQQANKQQSLIESFLDSDGDGSVLDDVAALALGGDKGGIGGMLGGLFGK